VRRRALTGGKVPGKSLIREAQMTPHAPGPLAPDSLASRIREGYAARGAMIFECFSPGIAPILVNAGAEFVIFDMEHTGLGFEQLKWLNATCRGLPITPMVRVPRNQYTYIARALDLGSRGIMVPMVESAREAAAIVESCWYPPKGRRGAAFGFAQCDYLNTDVVASMPRYNQRTLIIAQIETERGLAELDAIAATPGIDVLWLGHFDLSNFMGIPAEFASPAFDAAFRSVAQKAREHGKAAGFMASTQDWVQRARQAGYHVIAAGTDSALLQDGFSGLIRSIR